MKSCRNSSVKKNIITVILFHLITLIQAQTKPAEDLPLLLFPESDKTTTLIVYVTGDGGWNTFSQGMSNSFQNEGYSVVVLDSKKYFWTAKTPEQFARNLEAVIARYLKEWKKTDCVIAGYSFGADVIPFLPAYLSPGISKKIGLIALISPGISTDFEIHVSDFLSDTEPEDRKYKTLPIIQQSPIPTVCIFGSEERLLLKTGLKETKNLRIVELPGSHHFNHDTEVIVNQILTQLQH